MKTTCPRGHRYDLVLPARDGKTQQGCATCRREANRQWRQRKRQAGAA